MYRIALYVEALLLVACGLVCLFFPDTVNWVIRQPALAEHYSRRALGIALIALAIPLFQLTRNQIRLDHLLLLYRLLPGIFLATVLIGAIWVGFPSPVWFWWSVILALGFPTVALWFRRVGPSAQGKVLPDEKKRLEQLKEPTKFSDPHKLHEMRMRYAWDWFQYHADQRLKAFNFFLVIAGILVAAYGTAMKEALTPIKAGEIIVVNPHAESYERFAAAVATCGMVIAIAFLCIEVRNVELVDCGRKWLDSLEQDLKVSIREYDKDRLCLPPIVRGKALGEFLIKHVVWIRVIYVITVVGFGWAAWKALEGFD